MSTATRIPFVDYLVLEPSPHLVANECTACGARYFDRRNACAACFATDFRSVDIATEGEVRAFTIVTFAAPGVDVWTAASISGARPKSGTSFAAPFAAAAIAVWRVSWPQARSTEAITALTSAAMSI